MEPAESIRCPKKMRCVTFFRLGVELTFEVRDDELYGEFTGDERLMGHDGIMSGGFLASMMDEALGNVILAKGINVVTGKLEVRYRRPARLGVLMQVHAWIEEPHKRGYKVKGEIRDDEGVVLDCTALMVPVKYPLDPPKDWVVPLH